MNGQDQQLLKSSTTTEVREPQSQQQQRRRPRPRQAKSEMKDDNEDLTGHSSRQELQQKPMTTLNRAEGQQQHKQHKQFIQYANNGTDFPKWLRSRYNRRRPQENDKVVAEVDPPGGIADVQLNDNNEAVLSSNKQGILEKGQQLHQPISSKKSKKRGSKTKKLQKDENREASDADGPGNSTGDRAGSVVRSGSHMNKLKECTTNPVQPPKEDSENRNTLDDKRRDSKKKTGEKKSKFEEPDEASDRFKKQMGQQEINDERTHIDYKDVPSQQANKSDMSGVSLDQENGNRHKMPKNAEQIDVSTKQDRTGKALSASQQQGAKAKIRSIVEETGPFISKGRNIADKEREKTPKSSKKQQIPSAFNAHPTQDLARNRNIPIEITVYQPASRRHRQKLINFDENLLPTEMDFDAIHFASGSPYKTPGKPGQKIGDREFSASEDADRVLVELPSKPPKKQTSQRREVSKLQRSVPEKRELSESMTSKPQASYVHPDDRDPRHQRLHFSPYLSPESIEQGIRSGNLIRGILRISKRDRSDAYVVPDTLDSDIFIHGQRDRNRALDGDVVAVRMLDVDVVWKKKKEAKRKRTEENAKIRANAEAQADTNAEECHGDNGNMVSEVDEETEEESELDECDAAEELNEDKSKPKYAGEIVGILDRDANQTFAGTLSIEMPGKKDSEKLSPRKGDKKKEIRLVWFRPTDKRMPLMAITLGSIPQDFLSHQDIYSNMLFTAQIVRWSIDSRHPLGRIVTAIGSIGTIAAETLAILSDNNVKGSGFSDVVINSLPKTPWSIPAKEYDIRRDLREVRIFTIDPATAKDLDDAVHVKRLEDGIFEVGVHIADVSYFVKKNTPLDTEARERGTSTYLVDRVIPMLPSLLCEELCSLNPSVERLAFSVIWKMDEFANILDTWFGRTIIKSCAKLAYDDAQSVIDGNGLPSSVTVTDQSRQDIRDDIMHLYNLSRQMRKRRFENGALSINSIRLCFELDDSGEPKDVWVYELKAANRLIEEFMLCANMSVAEKIINHFPDEALLRRHAPPLEKRLDEFLQLSEKLGYHLDGSSSGSLQESFNAIESEQAKAVLTILAIKPMQRAKYFCTGAIDIARYSHYALNVPLYTHFTSPIRRYADIIVHRLLDASLQGKKASGYDTKKVQKIALDCNRKSDGARNAQDQSIQLYLAHYLQRLEQTSGPIIRSAVVVQVTKEAFDVIVPEYGIEKRIPLDTLPITKAKLDSSDFSLSIYWQKGVPVPSREDGSPTYIMEPVESTSDDDIESCPSLPVAKPSQIAALPSETYDPDTGMQQLKVFTKFDVLIKAAIARSPPIINVYPINPYV